MQNREHQSRVAGRNYPDLHVALLVTAGGRTHFAPLFLCVVVRFGMRNFIFRKIKQVFTVISL